MCSNVSRLRRTFLEVICPLFFGVDFQDGDIAIGDVAPKEVPHDEEVLRPVGDTLFCGEKKSAVVVFKDTASNCRLELGRKTKCRDDFSEKQEIGVAGASSCSRCGRSIQIQESTEMFPFGVWTSKEWGILQV